VSADSQSWDWLAAFHEFFSDTVAMDPYDSDSSLEDAGDYTETGVLLGYASTEQTDDTISHLGGWPVIEAIGF
jgi:hypothetical protein